MLFERQSKRGGNTLASLFLPPSGLLPGLPIGSTYLGASVQRSLGNAVPLDIEQSKGRAGNVSESRPMTLVDLEQATASVSSGYYLN